VGQPDGLMASGLAVLAHLPRLRDDATHIRVNASLMIILVTDRPHPGLAPLRGQSSGVWPCPLPPESGPKLDELVAPHLELLSGITDPEAATIFHHIGGTCGNGCGVPVTHVYQNLTRRLHGQVMSICQEKLGSSLQVIIDSIAGCSCPMVLDHRPVSSSLAVASFDTRLSRSRINGFDFRSASNSLVLINVPYTRRGLFATSYLTWAP
jgi:hypothetical protein